MGAMGAIGPQLELSRSVVFVIVLTKLTCTSFPHSNMIVSGDILPVYYAKGQQPVIGIIG